MVLEVEVYKSFNDFTLDVNFKIDKGTIGFLGSSGSGKSMTLRCIAGLVTPDRGRIVLNGRTLFDSKQKINLSVQERNVGFLFQNYALFPNLTVRENIAFGLRKLSKQEQIDRIEQKLEMMQLSELQNRYPAQLSGGQQQRTALARALVMKPECLLLDEPFSALDNHIRNLLEKELLETLENYQGVTVYVSHNLEECYRISEDIVVMEKGRVAAFSDRDDIFHNPPNIKAARLTGCRNFSKINITSEDTIKALDWGCDIKVNPEKINFINLSDSDSAYVGIREHNIFLVNDNQSNAENIFSCWVAEIIETPYKVTIYLNLKNAPRDAGDYQIQTEIFKTEYEELKDRPFPWYVQLQSDCLFFMEN